MGWDISISAEEGVNKRIGNTSSSPFTESVRTKSLRLGVLTDVLAAKDVFLRNLVHYRPSRPRALFVIRMVDFDPLA